MHEYAFAIDVVPARWCLLPKLRRLFGRSELERDELNILRGILDAVEKKIGA